VKATLIDRLEPGIWALFGAGFMVGSLLLPAWIFALGIAAPLGWIPVEALSFERAHALAAGPLGRLLLLALIALPIWNGANHLRHFLIDLGGYERDKSVAPLLYAGAALLSVVAIAAVARI
jgi:fumarate reductase subunit D